MYVLIARYALNLFSQTCYFCDAEYIKKTLFELFNLELKYQIALEFVPVYIIFALTSIGMRVGTF